MSNNVFRLKKLHEYFQELIICAQVQIYFLNIVRGVNDTNLLPYVKDNSKMFINFAILFEIINLL